MILRQKKKTGEGKIPALMIGRPFLYKSEYLRTALMFQDVLRKPATPSQQILNSIVSLRLSGRLYSGFWQQNKGMEIQGGRGGLGFTDAALEG